MTHTTEAGEIANSLLHEAKKLEQIGEAATHDQALQNRKAAAQYRKIARLHDLSVREIALKRILKNGEIREYWRWIASWRIGKLIITKYLGPSQGKNAISEAEALQKASELKRESLGVEEE